jgi:EAL domain-containing protein (putative c-di-GMP-specific phosphodiesterase class I)
MGVRLALDDFGTGYSSLIYLRRFAFDKIKLDKSFLDSMEDTGESAILVHSVVHLGRALGLTVTAEGVETADQQRFLQAVGCHLLQGYHFAQPMPAAKLDALLAAGGRLDTTCSGPESAAQRRIPARRRSAARGDDRACDRGSRRSSARSPVAVA